MRQFAFLGAALLAAVGLSNPASPQAIFGFSPAHAAKEQEREALFQSLPSADQAREWHRIFTANPHPAASPENTRLAGVIAREWRKQGWESVTCGATMCCIPAHEWSLRDGRSAPLPSRTSRSQYAVDPDTNNPAMDTTYFGYSASGDVTAELVYAHNGNPEDYELLRQHGISVNGKVVIVRYSNPTVIAASRR